MKNVTAIAKIVCRAASFFPKSHSPPGAAYKMKKYAR